MNRKAYVLLERDLAELRHNNYVGITAFPVNEDKMKWKAEIRGLQNSVWHGLVFQLTITFTSEYNLAPPVVQFTRIPFHPNVDPYTGRPCMDFLDNPDKWNTSYTLSSILLALQVMLSNPMLENPVNLAAAQMLTKNEQMYTMVVQKLFQESSQLNDDWLELPEEPHKFIRQIKPVSFDDYYKTWSGIATSKATEHYRIPLLEDPVFIQQYYKRKKMDLQYPKEWKLKFAATKSRIARENRMPHRANRSIERMYLCPTPNDLSSESQSEINNNMKIYKPMEEWKNEASPEDDSSEESWEDEAENLVAWTSGLNIDTLED